jgi:iron complex outermembrane recepter protein
MSRKYVSLLSTSAIAIVSGICPTFWQSAYAQSAQQTTNGGSEDQIQEIIVTANKREENLNQVGLTVTALSADVLKEHQIVTVADIANAVPGLSFAQTVDNTPVLTLRGVGFNNSSLGVYPAVSAYSDQVPLPFAVMASHSAFDLQRVEVLKGPQGTLFGENSTGGAINFVPQHASDVFEAGGDIGYGRFNQVNGDAYVSGALTDNLKARVSITGLNADGWQLSDTRPGDRNGSQHYVAGRILVDWEASDSIRFSLNMNGWTDQSQPQEGQFIGFKPESASPAPHPQELLQLLSPQTPRSADWDPNFPPSGDRTFYQGSLRADIDITKAVTFTSLTSYDSFHQRMTGEGDGSSLATTDVALDDGRIWSFNQELRLANSSTSRARWVVGGNFERSSTFETQDLEYPDAVNSNPGLLGQYQDGQSNGQETHSYAGFGNLEYDILDNFTLKGGARYTKTNDTGTSCDYDLGDGHVADLINFLGSALGTRPFTPVGSTGPEYGRCVALNADFVPSLAPYTAKLDESNVSWRVGADYRVSQDMLLYANVSRGYKAGSFPTLVALLTLEFNPVTQESVTAYEAGVKASFLDRRMHVDLAGFYYDYKNKQVDGAVNTFVLGPQATLVNVPKSRIAGIDGDISMIVAPGLTVGGAATYLNTKILDYTGESYLGVTGNFAGSRLPFAPTWSYSFNVDYSYALGDRGAPFAGISVVGRSTQDTTIGGSSITVPANGINFEEPGLVHPFTTNAYALVDLRAGYRSPGDKWTLTLWGKNVLNKYYWNNSIVTADDIVRYAGLPATYGVTVAAKFR